MVTGCGRPTVFTDYFDTPGIIHSTNDKRVVIDSIINKDREKRTRLDQLIPPFILDTPGLIQPTNDNLDKDDVIQPSNEIVGIA